MLCPPLVGLHFLTHWRKEELRAWTSGAWSVLVFVSVPKTPRWGSLAGEKAADVQGRAGLC